jgi:hypothetical protein
VIPGVEAVQEFILWARKHHVNVARFRYGDVEVEFTDPQAMAPDMPNTAPVAAPRSSIYEEFAGDLAKSPTTPNASVEPTEEDEGDD